MKKKIISLLYVCIVESSWDLIVKISSIPIPHHGSPRYLFLAYVFDLLCVTFKSSVFSRFLLQGKSLVPSQMYSVHFAWMPEVFSLLYNVSHLNVSSKFSYLLITSQPCGGGGVLIPLVSCYCSFYNRKLVLTRKVFLDCTSFLWLGMLSLTGIITIYSIVTGRKEYFILSLSPHSISMLLNSSLSWYW